MDRSTKTHYFLPPITAPEPGGLEYPLKSTRGFFWHPLTLMPDHIERISAYAPGKDELAASNITTPVVAYRRSAVYTRLSRYQDPPIKMELDKPDKLKLELYIDTYSYVQRQVPYSTLGEYPPKEPSDVEWSDEDHWIISVLVLVFHFEVPKPSKLCWHPRTNVHQAIREILDPEDPPNPLFSESMGVDTNDKVKHLPARRYAEDEVESYIAAFLERHYNDSAIPPKPAPQLGGTWEPVLSEDEFYFIRWEFKLAQPPTPTP